MPRIARASGRRGRARGQHGRGRDIPALELPEQLVTTSETLQTEARNRNGDAVQSMAPNPQQILEGLKFTQHLQRFQLTVRRQSAQYYTYALHDPIEHARLSGQRNSEGSGTEFSRTQQQPTRCCKLRTEDR